MSSTINRSNYLIAIQAGAKVQCKRNQICAIKTIYVPGYCVPYLGVPVYFHCLITRPGQCQVSISREYLCRGSQGLNEIDWYWVEDKKAGTGVSWGRRDVCVFSTFPLSSFVLALGSYQRCKKWNILLLWLPLGEWYQFTSKTFLPALPSWYLPCPSGRPPLNPPSYVPT